ncbi:MAG: hypothetical protein ACQKBY_00800 [Verrucomicrobiales bacterium]
MDQPPPIPAQPESPYQSPVSPPPPPVSSQSGDDFGMRLLLPVGRSPWAIAAGYLGLFALIIIPAPLALIVSIIALIDLQKSKKSERPKHGMGRALFGLITGLLGSIALLFFFLG